MSLFTCPSCRHSVSALADLLDWHGSATSPAGLQCSSRVAKLEGGVQA